MTECTQGKIWLLYIITNLINNKKYVGQSVNISKRWSDHRRAFYTNKPSQAIHYAFLKYGIDNFKFEVVASCLSQEDANDLETKLVDQYNTYIQNGCGYNATYGGMNAPKSEEWKAAWHNWWNSLSEDDKNNILKKRSESYIKYLKENDHPCLGQRRTEEQRARMSEAQQAKDFEAIYTEEVRKRFSEAHIGKKQSKDLIEKRIKSIKLTNEKKIKEKTESGELKCNVPGCEVHGKATYIIVDGIRYCSVHGQRLKRTGSIELGPRTSHNKGKKTPEEVLEKLRGRKPHNRREFTNEQIRIIMDNTRSVKSLSREFGVTEKVIVRVRKENIE